VGDPVDGRMARDWSLDREMRPGRRKVTIRADSASRRSASPRSRPRSRAARRISKIASWVRVTVEARTAVGRAPWQVAHRAIPSDPSITRLSRGLFAERDPAVLGTPVDLGHDSFETATDLLVIEGRRVVDDCRQLVGLQRREARAGADRTRPVVGTAGEAHPATATLNSWHSTLGRSSPRISAGRSS
jgi:hypothetical protein